MILRFDDRAVEDMRDLPRMVAETPVGETVRVTVWRDGATRTLRVTLGRLEEAEQEMAALSEAGEGDAGAEAGDALGMALAPLSDARRSEFAIGDDVEGVVVTAVEEGSEAFEKGVRSGDVIVEVAQQPVSEPGAVAARVEEVRETGRGSVLFLVNSEGELRFVALPLE